MSGLSRGLVLGERFTLIRPLGRGGEAEVWLVRDEVLGERMAAKILPPGASEAQVALLQRECRQARRLVHPNIVKIYDLRRHDGYDFITMAWVEGDDLRALRGAAPAEILRTLLPVADALAYAHEQGVVHRDLKSSNVSRDASGIPFLLDFGIAGVPGDAGELALRGGGSLHAASPQQWSGREPAPADDIYAFGTLLHELIEGHPPFWPEIDERRVQTEVPAPPRSEHRLPPRLISLVASLLAKSPAGRPRDMRTVARKISEILEQLPDATPAREPRGDREVTLVPPPRVPPIRPITPDVVTTERPHSRRRTSVGRVLAMVAIPAVILVAIFGLLSWLGERVRQDETAGSSSAVPETAAEPTPDPVPVEEDPSSVPGATAFFRKQAEELLGRAVALLEELESKGARSWAGQEYRNVESQVASADAHLTAGEFLDARDAYAEAVKRLEALDSRVLEVLQETLRDGDRALTERDSGRATAAFRLALEIAPDNVSAAGGLRRASVLDRVVALVRTGAEDERGGRVDLAVERYREAVGLDPMSPEARDSLSRARGRLSADAFADAMSDGLSALGDGEYEQALEAFRRADAIRSGTAEVKDGIAQAEESLKLEAIAQHRGRAVDLEAAEQWSAAALEFQAVLELDPTIRFAQAGRERCRERAALEERVVFHLNSPGRLTSDSVYTEAVELYDEASAVEPIGPKHRQQLDRLDVLIESAGKRVTILLESDNLTEVTVYRVGRLGTFTRRELALRPGTYTVVGSRRGYRDVRSELVVKVGNEPVPLVVRCQEKI